MSEQQQAVFEGWAIVEMMGHQREIGFVTTQAFGQAVMFRVDTPELVEREFTLTVPEWTENGDVRSWTPEGAKVKRAARTAIEKSAQRPLILLEVPAGLALPAPQPQSDDEECDQCGQAPWDCKCC